MPNHINSFREKLRRLSAARQFLSLLGSSGCGKTTTLSMTAGFEAPSGGEILIRRRLDALPPEKRDIGMVF